MSYYAFLKFIHVTSVIVCLGGIFARQVVRSHAKRTNDIQSFVHFSQAASYIEKAMVLPGMAAILVFGIILGLIGHFPIFGFLQGAQQNWLLVSIILLVGTQIIIPTIFIPRGKIFRRILEEALTKREITPELRAAMDDTAVRLAHLYEEVALIVVTALMILKPF